MAETASQLIERAQQYTSPEEFKLKDLPGYLLARKNRLLHIAFPRDTVPAPKPGICYLYRDLRVVYIGMSEIDIKNHMQSKAEEENINVNHYKLFYPHSSADIRVLYHYLVAKYKPKYNTDVVSDLLTITIPEATSLLGKPDKGQL